MNRGDHAGGHPEVRTRADALALDAADPLAALRELFDLPAGTIYLDGNSLGALPAATAARLQRAVTQEWGRDLIGSWNSAGWLELPHRVGDKIARLVGAGPGELVVTDSTSVNLHKALTAAMGLAAADAPGRRVVVSERTNFPTDLYLAEAVAREHGGVLRLLEPDQDLTALLDELGSSVAVLLLTHVNYRTGAMWDMAEVTALAHERGILTIWDLCHSAGAVPVDLTAAGADLAVGCGYKFLNGGPGAPAFVWVSPRLVERTRQPLAGWMGHAAPFAFTTSYEPAPGIGRFLSGTPGVLATIALECGVDTLLAAEPYGGMAAIRAKSLALTRLLAGLAEQIDGVRVASPPEDARRGSQVSLVVPGDGYAVVQALIARGVVGDFRAGDGTTPDIVRLGVTPLYTRFVDAWDAASHLGEVLVSGEWRQERFTRRLAVT